MVPNTFCPVCNYDMDPYEPNSYNICPQCGIEFGSDDEIFTHEDLRASWIAKGRPIFHSQFTPCLAS